MTVYHTKMIHAMLWEAGVRRENLLSQNELLSALQTEMTTAKEFGTQMLIRRMLLNVSRTSICDVIGYDSNAVKRWELGETYPSIYKATDWAEALGYKLTIKITKI